MTLFDPSPHSVSHLSLPSGIETTEVDRLSAIGSEADAQEGVMSHQVMKANVHTTRAVARMLLMRVDFATLGGDMRVADLSRNSREDLLNKAGAKGSPGRKGIESIFYQTDLGAETMQNNMTDLLFALTR